MPDHIVKIESFPVRPRWLFVRVETAQGAVGWGEATLEGHVEAVMGAIDAACDRLIGHDSTRIEDAWQLLHRLGFYRGGPVLLSAISGIDQALWEVHRISELCYKEDIESALRTHGMGGFQLLITGFSRAGNGARRRRRSFLG